MLQNQGEPRKQEYIRSWLLTHAPIGENLKSGRLTMPYKGIVDAGRRAVAEEGVISLFVHSAHY